MNIPNQFVQNEGGVRTRLFRASGGYSQCGGRPSGSCSAKSSNIEARFHEHGGTDVLLESTCDGVSTSPPAGPISECNEDGVGGDHGER